MRPEDFLEEVLRSGLLRSRDLHITRMCSALVAVSEGRVVKVSDPEMRYCPLAETLYTISGSAPIDSLKRKIIEAVERKIAEFGLFTDARQLYRESVAIPFGASEMIMYDLMKGGADAAITVCDGAGTVIAENPYLVQGIGARMNGIFYTSPIEHVIKRIREMGGLVPFTENARIDQAEGLRAAAGRYKRVDVTVNGFSIDSLGEIRDAESESGLSATVLAVCNTGISGDRVKEIARHADLVWACGSRMVREVAGAEALLQAATKIPVFCLTKRGMGLVANYSTGGLLRYFSEHRGPFLISGQCPRVEGVRNVQRIGMGNFKTYVGEVERLPVRSSHEPEPLL
ncbi:MAG: DUF2099 family protein [Candidatus Bathyarchaeia archaeon]